MSQLRTWAWVFSLLFVAFTCTTSGRVTYPDDEVEVRTAEAIWDRGELDIAPLALPRPGGGDLRYESFGVTRGVDGRSYGFFGYGLPLVTAPSLALADALSSLVPGWVRAPRRDLFSFHPRDLRVEMRRLVITSSNCVIAALAMVLFGLWLEMLAVGRATAVATVLVTALATSWWSYTSTFLSEPLSTVFLLVAVMAAMRWRRYGEVQSLWLAALTCGLSPHVHLLNVLAAPCIAVYAWSPPVDRPHAVPTGSRRAVAWIGAMLLGGAGWLSVLGLDAMRFGDPFESGRYDWYAHWVSPIEALAAFLIAPGRSLFIYAPPLLVALFGIRRVARTWPAEAKLALALVLTRTVFVAARSDWYGGWGIGPRYLLPILPFAMLPFALVWTHASKRARLGIVLLCGLSTLIAASYAYHSIFEHMSQLVVRHGDGWENPSHWRWSETPLAGFLRFDAPVVERAFAGDLTGAMAAARFDALSFGALRLGLVVGDWSLFGVFGALGALGLVAAWRLARGLRLPANAPEQRNSAAHANSNPPLARQPET